MPDLQLLYKVQRLLISLFMVMGLIWSTEAVMAQSVTVSGIITDQVSSQPLEGANVILLNEELDISRGMSADRNGFYQINRVQPGIYLMEVTYIGYIAYQDTLVIESGQDIRASATMEPDAEQLDDVVVSGRSGGAARREGGAQRVTSIDLARIPTPAGGGDLSSYLRTLPGVVASGDRGGQLFIRGGTPSENMVLIDGTMIYQPFHIVGFFSAFPEDLVAGADFYAGGFGPRYSSRTSSVLDVQMRFGDLHQVKGSGSVSPFLAEALAEGPIREGTSSWIASVRQSMIEQTSPVFLGGEHPLRFGSQFLKLSHIEDDFRCSTMAIRTSDQGRLDFEGDDVIRWSNFVIGGRCAVLPEGSRAFLDLNVGLSRLANTVGSSDLAGNELYSNTTRFNMDVNITQFTGSVKVDYGVFTHLKFLNYDMRELFFDSEDGTSAILGMGAYLETSIPLGRNIMIQPGTALSVYINTYAPSLEPRFRATWQPLGREDEELSAAVGIYRQALVGVTDMRDASSVFTAWMPAPEGGSQMQATHALLGWQQALGAGFQWSVEGYYKRLKDMPVTVWSTLARFNTDLALADGNVYGGDARLEYRGGAFYGFLGYGYSWTEYVAAQDHFSTWFGEPIQRYHPPHDRRHQINTQVSVDIGSYTTGIGWQLGTGLPFTRPMGFDELILFGEQLPEVRDEYGTPRVILDRPYSGRMPTYHRLDVSLKRSFDLNYGQIDLQVGAINLYDQPNMFYYDVYTHRRIDQLPIAPYFSLKMGIP